VRQRLEKIEAGTVITEPAPNSPPVAPTHAPAAPPVQFEPPASFEPPGQSDPPRQPGSAPAGLRPAPDPTRSGARWVGGAGVALLLAAAAVLTAVRWDDIGQSAKLGGLMALTVAMMAAGRKFKETIPMTAQALFHLGALLIPFDMAAIAILTGRSWQETLLLTSITSVLCWYAIAKAEGSELLLWSARAAVVVGAAGIAAVTPATTALVLAVAAALAVPLRKPIEAAGWALIAGVLPLASFVTWPSRIAGAATDLGFAVERWQSLAAGIIAVLALVATSQIRARVEIAWAAILVAVVTVMAGFGAFAESTGTSIALAAIFVAIQLLALTVKSDVLWTPILKIVAAVGELFAGVGTVGLLIGMGMADALDLGSITYHLGVASTLLAVGWLIADSRRLTESARWYASVLLGSNWFPATVMVPVAVLAAGLGFLAPTWTLSLLAIGLAFWMVATWREHAVFGALLLVVASLCIALVLEGVVALALGAAGAAVLAFAAQLELRRHATDFALAATLGAIGIWFGSFLAASTGSDSRWPVLLLLAGAWALGWLINPRDERLDVQALHWLARLAAFGVAGFGVILSPAVSLSLIGLIVALVAVDYILTQRQGAQQGDARLTALTALGGAAVGLVGIPLGSLLGVPTAVAGAGMAVAAFVLVGIALVSPRVIEVPLGFAAGVASFAGLILTFGYDSLFALALMAAGATVMLAGAALRDRNFAVVGYMVSGLGVSLQLATWDVTWLEPYLIMPAAAALLVGYQAHLKGVSSWVAFAPTIALLSYISIAARIAGGPAWHSVIAGAIGVLAIIAGGHQRLIGPLLTGSLGLAGVVIFESLGPASLVPTWAWLATGGAVLLAAGVAMEQSDTSPLERGQQIRQVVATQFS